MVIGIGLDIIEVNRVEKAAKKQEFMDRCFTADEIKLFEARNYNYQVIAGNFAVKEAVMKAMGEGLDKLSLKDIEVLRDLSGKPYVNLYKGAKNSMENLNIKNIFVSISHLKDLAAAQAVVEG